MNRDIKANIFKVFRETMSVDYLRETFPKENIEEIINCLMEKHLLLNRPKMQYMAGVQTYIVSDDDIIPRVQQALNEGSTKANICKQFHIGHTRLNKLIEKYGLTVNEEAISDSIASTESKATVERQKPKAVFVEHKDIDKGKEIQIESTTNNVIETDIVQEVIEDKVDEKTEELKYTDEELKNLIDKGLAEGKTRTQLTRELHVSLKRINRVLAGKPVKVAKTTISSNLIAQLQNYLRYGTTNESIAKNMSMSVNSVKNIRKLLKLTKVPAGKETSANEIPTIEEKIVYANKTYGVGRWKFLTRDEFKNEFRLGLERGFEEEDDFYA